MRLRSGAAVIVTCAVVPEVNVAGKVPTEHHEAAQVIELTVSVPPPEF